MCFDLQMTKKPKLYTSQTNLAAKSYKIIKQMMHQATPVILDLNCSNGLNTVRHLFHCYGVKYETYCDVSCWFDLSLNLYYVSYTWNF